MDTDIAFVSSTPVSIQSQQAGTSPKRLRFALALSLSIVVGALMLDALMSLTQSASAQTAVKGQGSDALPIFGAPVSPGCGPNWVVAPGPTVGPTVTTTYLYGVSALSSSDVWTVGTYAGASTSYTLIEHWDGSRWSQVPSPSPGTQANVLSGITAISSDNIWVVGAASSSSGTGGTLILHWDGSTWNIVPSPNPGRLFDALTGVSAISANDIWAVGYSEDVGIYRLPYQTLALHWDGSAWSAVPSLNAGTSDNYLKGVAAISANDVWAVGYYYDGSIDRTLTEHWDGSTWSIVPSTDPGTANNYLQGVAAVSANDVWAVGYYYNSGSSPQTLALHWDGSVWSQVSSPNPGTIDELFGVTAVSTIDVWAVGNYENGSATVTLIEHWNGSEWSVVPSPNLGTYEDTLYAVAASSTNDVWAVGVYRTNPSNPYLTLVERYNPCTNTPTPGGPTLTSTMTPTSIPTYCTLQFADVPNPSVFYRYIQCLACKGIIHGYLCGGVGEPCDPNHDPYFRPNADITRGQIAKIVALSAQINTPVSGQTFQDVPPASTFYTYIEQLHALGVMGGYVCGGIGEPCIPPNNRPYFRPGANATRGQLAKIDSLTAGYNDPPSGQQFQDIPIGSTYYPYAYRLVTRSIMGGYTCGGSGEPCVPPANLPYFRANNDVTRGQTSKIVANTFYPNCQAP